MNKIIIILLMIPFSIYTQSSVDIRGYQFGENYSYILNNENKKNFFQIIPYLTNNNRLAYSGKLFNQDMRLFFHFRDQRLSQMNYVWEIPNNDILFYNQLKRILENKYQINQEKTIQSQQSTIYSTSLIQIVTNNDIITPVLSINLERIVQTNQPYTVILEFQAFDADKAIKQKILSEDL